MRKKYIFLLIIFLLIALSACVFHFFKVSLNKQEIKKEDMSIQEVIEGTIDSIDDSSNSFSIAVAEVSDSEVVNSILKVNFDNNLLEVYKNSGEIKSEEQFRKEEQEFKEVMQKLKDSGQSTTLLNSPSWEILNKIDKSALQKGNKVKVYLYKKNQDAFAKKIIILSESQAAEDNAVDDSPQIVTFFGVITEIDGKNKKIKLIQDCESCTEKITEEFIFNDNTAISKETIKTQDGFLKEQADFNKKIAEAKKKNQDDAKIEAPSWFLEEKVNFSYLKVGDKLEMQCNINKTENTYIVEVAKILK